MHERGGTALAPPLRWLLWLDGPRPGWLNMAIDATLLDRAARDGAGVLRLYGWSPSCLSFGAHEPALRRYDRDRIAALGLEAVRRPTGGRAVWHDGEVTYAVAAPDTFGALSAAYRMIHETIARALEHLGVTATLAARPARAPALDADACFTAPVGGEILASGRKVVGSAQVRRGGAFLQHGSILLRDTQSLVETVSRAPGPPLPSLPSLPPVPPGPLAEAFAEAARAWGDDWADVADAEAIVREAEASHPEFRDPAWTWRR